MLDSEQTQNKGQIHLCQTTRPITKFGTLSKIQVEYYVHQKEEKLSDLPTLLVQDELLLDNACKDGTEYKRLNLKNPDELHIMSPPQVSDKLQ